MIAVVKYNAGNIFSVMNALGRLGVEAVLTDDAAKLNSRFAVDGENGRGGYLPWSGGGFGGYVLSA